MAAKGRGNVCGSTNQQTDRESCWTQRNTVTHGLTWQKCIPRTLFPTLSRGGDQHITPMTLGITSSMAPDTPDLAGTPTWEMTGVALVSGQQMSSAGKVITLNSDSSFISVVSEG